MKEQRGVGGAGDDAGHGLSSGLSSGLAGGPTGGLSGGPAGRLPDGSVERLVEGPVGVDAVGAGSAAAREPQATHPTPQLERCW